MKNKTILLGVGALALIYFLYKRKKSVAQQEQTQVGVSQGEGVRDKASLFNLFTRTRYTNPTKTPKPRPQTLTPKVPKFAQTEQTPQKVRGNHAGIAQQQENVNKIQ